MKYIDAELLREKIAEQMESLPREVGRGAGTITSKGYGMMQAFQIMRSIIDSLQQEQPEKTLTFDGFVDKVGTWFANLRLNKFRKTFNGEIFPATQLVQEYDLFVRELSKTYSDKQEQPEVDLNDFTQKMDDWKARYNHPDNIPIKATMAFTARMFYMYPDVARQWYDSLPKVTMD